MLQRVFRFFEISAQTSASGFTIRVHFRIAVRTSFLKAGGIVEAGSEAFGCHITDLLLFDTFLARPLTGCCYSPLVDLMPHTFKETAGQIMFAGIIAVSVRGNSRRVVMRKIE